MNSWAFADSSQIKIAVLDFHKKDVSTSEKNIGSVVNEWFITALVKDGRFEIVERGLIQNIFEEQNLSLSGHVDTKNATKIGKILGAKLLVTGSILDFQNRFELNARLIDVETGTIIAAESLRNIDPATIEDDVNSITTLLINAIPLEGYVVKRNDNIITLDLGINSGVKKKMHFLVFEKGEKLIHPVTGKVLDIEIIKKGIVTVNKIKEKISEALIVSENTPGILQTGMLVKNITGSPNTEKKINLQGQWESYMDDPAKSFVSVSSDQKITWIYSVPLVEDDSEASSGVYCVFTDNYVSMRNKTLKIIIESQSAKPVYFSLYSFTPGFSKANDEESLVPVETILSLKPGLQTIRINPATMSVPQWWREDYKQTDIPFNSNKIHGLEFFAVIDSNLGAVSDTLIIHEVLLLPEQ